MDIVDAALPNRGGERGLGEAGPARGCDRPDVDQQRDSRARKLVEKLLDRLPFIADREKLQSNSSSRKLFLRLP